MLQAPFVQILTPLPPLAKFLHESSVLCPYFGFLPLLPEKLEPKRLTLRAPRVLVPTPSTKGGGGPTPVSQEREMLQT